MRDVQLHACRLVERQQRGNRQRFDMRRTRFAVRRHIVAFGGYQLRRVPFQQQLSFSACTAHTSPVSATSFIA